jgi:hypothetical protein
MELYELKTNTKYNSLEIYFTSKPDESTRESLKALKFRWNPTKKCWYGFANQDQVKKALDNVAVIPESKEVDPGTLYAGWEGGNARTWHSDKELKSFILSDLKKAGIKATIRFNRAGYLTSLTVTITISENDLKTYEEYKTNFDPYDSRCVGSWLYYTDEKGDIKSMHREKFFELEGNERVETLENITRTHYQRAKDHLKTDSCGYEDGSDILRPDAVNKYSIVKKIVASYNRDCSNSMVDYFDRDIYDHYSFKLA